MSYLKVSLGFGDLKDHGLETAASEILTAMTGNAHYPTPPVTMVELKDALDAFSAAMGSQWAGGPPATSDKNDKRILLSDLLIKLGSYVQIAANGDRTVLIGSGFKALERGHHPSTPLERPTELSVSNAGHGRLAVKVKRVKHARAYETRHTRTEAEPQVWQTTVFNSSRAMTVSDLTPGVTYTFQVRAIGGSTVLSDWSDPTSHMSM